MAAASTSVSHLLMSTTAGRCTQGKDDFFGVGVISGGWDEAAWAAKGLPTHGYILLTATVSEVAHSPALKDESSEGVSM